MGAFDQFSNPPVSGAEFDSIDPNSKYSDFDSSNLEAMGGQENAPSPDGAASQGALGNPATAGETPSVDGPAALGEEGPQDMLSIFNQSTPEDRAHMTEKVQDSYAPLGYSLEGAMDLSLMKGGPQALARAAEFGIDLMPFADKINPDGSYSKAPAGAQGAIQPQTASVESGQAFGAVPADGQAGPVKDQDQAAAEFEGAITDTKEGIRIKKLEQRQAIAAFLMEMGLRTLASSRDDAAGAMAEGALGTIDARRSRKRQADEDSIAAKQRERIERRQDEQDEAGKLEAQREEQDRQYEISQRPAEEAKTARAGMQEITNEAGEVYYFDPLDPEKGEYVEDAEGNRVKSADAGITPNQMEINRRAYRTARAKARTAVEKDIKEYDTQYPEIAEETDPETKKALIDAAVDEVLNRDGYDESGNAEETSYLDW